MNPRYWELWVQLPDGQEHHTGANLDDDDYNVLSEHLRALRASGEVAEYTLSVPNDDAHLDDVLQELDDLTGTEACRTCAIPYSTSGDGYDGECPECADKTADKKELTQEQED